MQRTWKKGDERSKKREVPAAPAEATTTSGDGSAGASRAQVGGSASSGSPAAAPTSASRKRGAEDPSGPEAVPQESSTNAGMEQDALVDPLARPGGTKRLGGEYPEDGYQTVEEAKQQEINLVENLVETM